MATEPPNETPGNLATPHDAVFTELAVSETIGPWRDRSLLVVRNGLRDSIKRCWATDAKVPLGDLELTTWRFGKSMVAVAAWIFGMDFLKSVLVVNQFFAAENSGTNLLFLLIKLVGSIVLGRSFADRIAVNARVDRQRLVDTPRSGGALLPIGVFLFVVPPLIWFGGTLFMNASDGGLQTFANSGSIVVALSTIGALILVYVVLKRSAEKSANQASRLSIESFDQGFVWVQNVCPAYLDRLPQWPGIERASMVEPPAGGPVNAPTEQQPASLSSLPRLSSMDD